ncbi:MAG: hypothetical protein JWP42_2112 [Pseudomonas sp.]|nr:hypothetical protein [Pseudomonas sp.]
MMVTIDAGNDFKCARVDICAKLIMLQETVQ